MSAKWRPRKERVDPLVHGVPPIVDGGFFEGIALPFGERFRSVDIRTQSWRRFLTRFDDGCARLCSPLTMVQYMLPSKR
jgi:hypothetical protein